MPFDFPPCAHPRLINRLARANALNDPATCDTWLRDRVDDAKRRQLLDELFPTCDAIAA
ncbi:hypothetical protein Z946_3795 [Sulfitobacter noctilucicola]|uniref:Uncharacterized protein n=1 Tax=Sulfitobacter noctilucicola TaxID=1342301 RepID=A0A7W6M7M8_9RHOB|nr:hypothetical protein Z946_3795 [Sulfitobacter noctilucicola]MBB4173955.1 hypothetical protein [Sulfitobacter noctilucicola]